MIIKGKNFENNILVHIIIFIKCIIITISLSWIFFHSLLPVQAIVIKWIILFLHRHGVFHKLGSVITALGFWYKYWGDWSIPSGEGNLDPTSDKNKNIDPEKEKEEEMGTTATVLTGIFGTIIFTAIGLRVVEEFFPGTTVYLKNTLYIIGTTFFTTLVSIYDKSKFEIGGGGDTASSAPADPQASEATVPDLEVARSTKAILQGIKTVDDSLRNKKGVLNAGRDAIKAYKFATDNNMSPSEYRDIITVLYFNNVPASKCINSTSVLDVLHKIMAAPENSPPLFSKYLTRQDRIFYKILDEATKELKKK